MNFDLILNCWVFFNKFAQAYVQEKYDVTGATKYNFLVEHTQYISFTNNNVH